jgi:hypothetical protein
VILQPLEIGSIQQIWTWTDNCFNIDSSFTLEPAPLLGHPQIKTLNDKNTWKITPDGHLQHQRSIQYLGIAKESVKEKQSLKCKKFGSKLSQCWIFVEKSIATREFAEIVHQKAKHVSLIESAHSITFEIFNESKHTLCQPVIIINNGKYDDLPYFIKNKGGRSTHEISEQVVVYGKEDFSGYVTYSVFDKGVGDDLLLIVFNWKEKKFHVEILNEKDLPPGKDVYNTYITKGSTVAFNKNVKCFGRLFKGKKFGVFLEFSDNDGTEWKEATITVDKGGRRSGARSFELRGLRKSGEKMFSQISNLILKPVPSSGNIGLDIENNGEIEQIDRPRSVNARK